MGLRFRNAGGWVLLALLLLCRVAAAEVKLNLDVGWNGYYRAGRWTPLFVTLADTSKSRQALIELYTPTDRRYAVLIRQSLAIGPAPVTVPIYLPLSNQTDE